MKLLLSIFLFLTSQILLSQIAIIEKRGKFGLVNDGDVVLKTKYKSIELKDSSVITAYTKKTTLFFNYNGELIYEPIKKIVSPFSDGIGFVYKDYMWGVINTEGQPIITLKYTISSPERYGNYIYIKTSDKLNNGLYNLSGNLIVSNINSVDTLSENKNFVVVKSDKTYNYTKRSGLLKLHKEKIKYDCEIMTLVQIETDKLINGDIQNVGYIKMENFNTNLLIFKTCTGSKDLYTIKGEKVVSHFEKITEIEKEYYVIETINEFNKREKRLIDRYGQTLIQPDYYFKILKVENYLYAFEYISDEYSSLTIFNLNGEFIKGGNFSLYIVDYSNPNYNVYLTYPGYVLGNKKGDVLSKSFKTIFTSVDGEIRVENNKEYFIINEKTLKIIKGPYPIKY